MTTIANRSQSALLVIDVQNGVVAGALHRAAVVGHIQHLIGRARAQDVPVVWIQHSDQQLEKASEAWQIVPELTPLDSEPLVHNSFGDAFEGTILEQVLAQRAVGKLVVVGAQTDACIRCTIHGAFTRGYDVTLVSDAHTTEDQSD